MAEDHLTIDSPTIFDNVDERRIEFDAAIAEERRAFAVQYDVLEALSGEFPLTNPVQQFHRHAARIARLGATALARDTDHEVTVISGNDLDQ